ncbi:MAG: peroxiredoxin Q/BCP [Erysipelotrichaceae bacterium]|nr:MAG: peroxiredoxin [Erysipelotrichaceae bacterium]TXT17445.1 MAG: peroxiredoxin Q/BCP [Erysipelotrichaceae bacterium]
MPKPNVNEFAPDFTLTNQNGEKRTLSDYRGQYVVLYFYPKDDTPGCTVQACSYRDSMKEFTDRNIKVFGISKDDEKSHSTFLAKFNLNFELLADEQKEVVTLYDVYKEKNMYGNITMGVVRTTFVIDPQGKIIAIFDKVKPEEDVQQVLSVIKN